MAHNINGLIASYDSLHRATAGMPEVRICKLNQDFGFWPDMDALSDVDHPAPMGEFYRFSEALHQWAVDHSRAFPIAYIETEYFGGSGTQAAVVWKNGDVIWGPRQSSNEHDAPPQDPKLDPAISHALKRLGVEHGTAIDEFDALGLGRHRSNNDWWEDFQ